MRLLLAVLTRAAVINGRRIFCAARRDASLDSDFKSARRIAILLKAKNTANRLADCGFLNPSFYLLLVTAKNGHKSNTLIDY